MKVNEIFNKKRIIAFVMAFAMVATLLSGVSFASQAADVEKTPVYSFYNAQNGDHVYCIGDDIQKAISFGLNNENVSWYAPTVSLTPVYRIYNPNTGEHLFTRDKAAGQKAVDAGWQWDNNGDPYLYSNDDEASQVAVYRFYHSGVTNASSHVYKSEKQTDDIAKLYEMGYVLEPGETIYGVDDASQVVALTDLNGFQADGTALKGDMLGIVFGSEFGVPSSVAWYKDGAVVAAYKSDITAVELTLNTGAQTYGAGTYYAQVENTKGEVYKTNEVVVVDEGAVILSDFGINDNYTGLAKYASEMGNAAATVVPTAPTTGVAVVDLTMNKLYAGNLYFVDASKEKMEIANKMALAANPDEINDDLVPVKASQFTDENFLKQCVNFDTGNLEKRGIYYIDSDNAVHLKLAAALADGQSFTRGTEYVAVFSETELTVDDLVEDQNTTDPEECPYVYAPTAVTFTQRYATTNTMPWTAQLQTMGMDSSWINGTMTTVGDLQIYATDNQDKSDSAEFNMGDTPVIAAGAATGTYNADKQYVYATFTSEPGIFAEDAVELESDVVEVAIASADSVTLDYSETNPYNAKATFTKLRQGASGTLLVAQGDSTTGDDYTKIAKKALTDPVAMTRVQGGATEVEVENVFSKVDTNNTYNNKFYAVFVPDDMATYAGVAGGADLTTAFTLNQLATYFTLDSSKTTIGGATGSGVEVATDVANKVLDQFQNRITGKIIGPTLKTYEMKALVADGATKSATLQVAAGSDGKATMTLTTYGRTGAAAKDAGTTEGESIFYAQVGGTYIVATKTENQGEWELSATNVLPTV